MLDEKEFINNVWNKYRYCLHKRKNNYQFFSRHLYRNTEYILAIKSFITFIIAILTASGIVYAGITTYNYIQKNTYTDFSKQQGYDYNQNMILNNSMYYKKINTYEEYKEAKKIWDNLVDMNQKDFKSYFMIILAGENYNTTGLYISDIYTKEQKLCIELRKKEVWSEKDTIISAKVSKELYKEEIEIINLPNDVDTTGKYKDIESILYDYSMEEAIKDNCFVINEKNQIVSNDKERLNEFVNNCNNNINDLLRICRYESNQTVIYDIEYKSNKINLVRKSVGNNVNANIRYRTGVGIEILKMPSTAGGGYYYSLYDEIGNKNLICVIID